MANFTAVTTSNSPRLSDPLQAKTILDHYYIDGEVEAWISQASPEAPECLVIYGYDWPGAWKIAEGIDPDEFEPDDDEDPTDGFEQLLREVAPCLEEPLTVQAVGFTDCRFPLAACEWYVTPGAAEVEVNGFRHCHDNPVARKVPQAG